MVTLRSIPKARISRFVNLWIDHVGFIKTSRNCMEFFFSSEKLHGILKSEQATAQPKFRQSQSEWFYTYEIHCGVAVGADGAGGAGDSKEGLVGVVGDEVTEAGGDQADRDGRRRAGAGGGSGRDRGERRRRTATRRVVPLVPAALRSPAQQHLVGVFWFSLFFSPKRRGRDVLVPCSLRGKEERRAGALPWKTARSGLFLSFLFFLF